MVQPQARVQVELHRHLDASVRPATLLRLAQERGLEAQSTSVEAFSERFLIHEPMRDLNAVLAKFRLFQQVLDRPEVLAQVAFEALEDCAREGTTHVEFRYSPGFVCELSHLSWEASLDGFETGLQRGLARYPGIRAGLICIGSRDFGVDSIAETVEFFLKHEGRFIGLDLAGNEADFPCRLFEQAFRPARDRGAKITVHAGEAAGAENVWEAIELLGARRIGHGIASVDDPVLLRVLRERRICLEVCPTSNWLTRAVPSLREHPLKRLLEAEVPVSINTDDPGIFPVNLNSEVEVCRKQLGIPQSGIEKCNESAKNASFLPDLC